VRASVGTRLKEVEITNGVSAALVLHCDRARSNRRDLDYSKAISDLALQQVTLEASQKTFVQVQGPSLFNYL